jgi:hypothetical protein
MKALSREAALQLAELPKELVPVPEFGDPDGAIYIRVMTGAERDAYEVGSSRDPEVTQNMRAKLIVRCACDESGALLFLPGDADALGAKNAVALDRLAQAADRINVLSERAVKDAMGKSGPSPGDALSSASP